MKTKTLLSIAIIAALPFMANAENISGNMYTAPTSATQQNPAPTTSAKAPYGRVNIDTVDQNHIATTAYVKGAYNSAIAGINKLDRKLDHAYVEIYINWAPDDPSQDNIRAIVPIVIPQEQEVQIEL